MDRIVENVTQNPPLGSAMCACNIKPTLTPTSCLINVLIVSAHYCNGKKTLYLIKTLYIAEMTTFPVTTRLYERLCWLFQLELFLTIMFYTNRELRQLFKNFHAFSMSYFIFNVKQKRWCFKVFHVTLLYFPPLHLNSNLISHLHRFKMAFHARFDVIDAKFLLVIMYQ